MSRCKGQLRASEMENRRSTTLVMIAMLMKAGHGSWLISLHDYLMSMMNMMTNDDGSDDG